MQWICFPLLVLSGASDIQNDAYFILQGDWVWLKKSPTGTVSSVNGSTEVVFVKVSEFLKFGLDTFWAEPFSIMWCQRNMKVVCFSRRDM